EVSAAECPRDRQVAVDGQIAAHRVSHERSKLPKICRGVVIEIEGGSGEADLVVAQDLLAAIYVLDNDAVVNARGCRIRRIGNREQAHRARSDRSTECTL